LRGALAAGSTRHQAAQLTSFVGIDSNAYTLVNTLVFGTPHARPSQSKNTWRLSDTAMKFRLALFLCLLFMVNSAFATTYYVAKAAQGGHDGHSCMQAQSVSTPKLTIVAGLACMSGGDTLYVRAGNYQDILNNAIPNGPSPSNPTVVQGYPGDPRPVMNGNPGPNFGAQASPIIYQELPSNIIWDGISLDGINEEGDSTNLYFDSPLNVTFRNFDTYNATKNGVQMYDIAGRPMTNVLYQNMKVHDNGLRNNVGTPAGHGFYIGATTNSATSNIVIDNCEFYGQTGQYGAFGVQLYKLGGGFGLRDVTVKNSYFHDNANGLLIGSGSNLKAYNNVVANNGAISGSIVTGINIGYNTTNNIQVYNNTVYGNGRYGLGSDDSGGGPNVTNVTVKNNILWNNGNGDAISPLLTGTVGFTASNNLCGGKGCLFYSDPLFVNAAANDFHLTSGSPAHNLGVDLSLVRPIP
jgi:hypothetical protein